MLMKYQPRLRGIRLNLGCQIFYAVKTSMNDSQGPVHQKERFRIHPVVICVSPFPVSPALPILSQLSPFRARTKSSMRRLFFNLFFWYPGYVQCSYALVETHRRNASYSLRESSVKYRPNYPTVSVSDFAFRGLISVHGSAQKRTVARRDGRERGGAQAGARTPKSGAL
eukprot:4786502-Pleurochrysis_carterae.AAC.4